MRRCKGTGERKRSATTRAATSASHTIDAVERLTRLSEGMTESLVLQREIMLRLHETFKRFTAVYTAIQELYLYCMALSQQRWVSMPEQADAAHAADSKEAHTGIHQAPNVSHTGKELLWRVIERPGSATRGIYSGRMAPLVWHGNGRPPWVE